MDNKTKYNKLKEVIDSMTDDERKSLNNKIEESLNSQAPSLEEYTRLVEEHHKSLKETNQKFLEEANKIAKNPNFKRANFIKIT